MHQEDRGSPVDIVTRAERDDAGIGCFRRDSVIPATREDGDEHEEENVAEGRSIHDMELENMVRSA
jgi:hypothetical protein